MAQGYITQEKDYWIHSNALSITLNALGNANRIQCSVSSGAVIRAFRENVNADDTLGWNAAHNYKSWPLTASPTYFNSNTAKYVYVAIPRTDAIGTQAVVVFPSELLDIYGKNTDDVQIGSIDYLYIFLGGIISATNGVSARTWTQLTMTGKLGTEQGDKESLEETEWYSYSPVAGIVTFLKQIVMSASSWFQTLRLGSAGGVLNGVATAATGDEYIDSDTLVVTPSYINGKFLSKKEDDTAAGNINFLQNVSVGVDLGVKNIISALTGIFNSIKSPNYSGSGVADTGFQLTNDDGTGASQLVVDNIVARMKFIANILEVRKLTSMGGNYVFSPAASIIEEVDYFDYQVTPGEETTLKLLGYSELKMPWLLRGKPTFLSRVANTLGIFSTKRLVRTTMSAEDWRNVKVCRCWLKADDGSTQTINTWRVGMLARCQTFDASQIEGGNQETVDYSEAGETWTGKSVTNKFYWRAVESAGQGVTKSNYQFGTKVLDDGKAHNFIDLSNAPGMFYSDSDMPMAGDHIVCYGDYLNQKTANIITIETVGEDAPAFKEYQGVGYSNGSTIDWNNALTNKMKTRISPVAGDRFVAPEFIIEIDGQQYNMYTTLKADINGVEIRVGSLENGKNLLKGVLTGTGWKSAKWGTRSYIFTDGDVEIDNDGWMIRKEDYTFISSPQISLAKGDYTLSFDAEGTGAISVSVIQLNLVVFSENTTSGDTRRTIEIPISNDNEPYRILITASSIKHPQLEVGTEATAFDAGDTEVSSSIKQTADSIMLSVEGTYETKEDFLLTKAALELSDTQIQSQVTAIKAGKNLLSGVLTGTGWRSLTSPTYSSGTPLHAVSVDDDEYLNAAEGDTYIEKDVALPSGKEYTLSFYSKKTDAITVTIFIVDYPTMYITKTIEASGASTRKVTTFTIPQAFSGTFGVSINATTVKNPQIELGGTATAFDAGGTEVSNSISVIKQTSSSIKAQVDNQAGEIGQLKITADNIDLSLAGGRQSYVINPLGVDCIVGTVDLDGNNNPIASEVVDKTFGKVEQFQNSSGGDWQLSQTLDDNWTELTGEYVTWLCVVKASSGRMNYGSGYENSNSGNSHAAIEMTAADDKITVQCGLQNPTGYDYYDLDNKEVGAIALGNGWYLCYVSVKLKSGRSIIPGQSASSYNVGFNSTVGTWQVYCGSIINGMGCMSIESIVQGAWLNKTGIDITKGHIELRADKVTFQNSAGSLTTPNISIDPNTGTLNAINMNATNGTFTGISVVNGTFNGSIVNSDSVQLNKITIDTTPKVSFSSAIHVTESGGVYEPTDTDPTNYFESILIQPEYDDVVISTESGNIDLGIVASGMIHLKSNFYNAGSGADFSLKITPLSIVFDNNKIYRSGTLVYENSSSFDRDGVTIVRKFYGSTNTETTGKLTNYGLVSERTYRQNNSTTAQVRGHYNSDSFGIFIRRYNSDIYYDNQEAHITCSFGYTADFEVRTSAITSTVENKKFYKIYGAIDFRGKYFDADDGSIDENSIGGIAIGGNYFHITQSDCQGATNDVVFDVKEKFGNYIPTGTLMVITAEDLGNYSNNRYISLNGKYVTTTLASTISDSRITLYSGMRYILIYNAEFTYTVSGQSKQGIWVVLSDR